MKREYIKPQITDILDLDTELLLSSVVDSSRVTGEGGNVDIDYGGIDTGGNKDPEAKKSTFYSVWDDNNPNLINDIWKDEEE
jgi:hypothetical protein